MNIVIRATEQQKQELLQKGFNTSVNVQWKKPEENFSVTIADAYFDLVFDDVDCQKNQFITDKPVFIHAVNCTCAEIDKPNYIRLNAWSGFLNRPLTEYACCDETIKEKAEAVFNNLEWKFARVKDDYGFVAARIIAMIINEAYFALEENVSTKQQIDIAMKLGTNYAYGPFEWSEKIGLCNVLNLLRKLFEKDSRYSISALLVHETQQF